MAELPKEQRAVLVLRAVEELSYAEIAESLGISPGTVMSRLYRARERLALALRPYLGRRGGKTQGGSVMSGHEHERLSAYLDDALPPRERAQVAAHIHACAECAGRLAELAAVDGAVASMPSEAPQGYFEALPALVRSRLEPRAAARRLPAWTWAAAAAVLLAVVTPLTLLRRSGSGHPPREIPAAAAPELAKSQATLESRATEAARAEPKAETQPQRPAPALASPAPKKRESGFAAAPTETDAGVTRAPAAPAVAQSAVPAPPASREEEVAAPLSDAGAMAEAVAPEARNQAKASGDRRAESSRDAVAPMASDEARLARGRAGGAAAGTVASPKLVAGEAELAAPRRRAAAHAGRVAARCARNGAASWRASPASPQADEARGAGDRSGARGVAQRP